nr:hypothetical protein [Pedobacter sp. ASV19]
MKTLGHYPNPAIDSRWCGAAGGIEFKLTIVGTYCSGTGQDFKIHAYELMYDNSLKRKVISADKLKEHIEKGELILI